MLTDALLLFVLQVTGAGPAPPSKPADLELVYLANEGFLIRCGEDAVLIDAFVEEPYSIYAGLPEAVRDRLLAGAPPFDSLDLALTSHFHRDHFQPRLACAFLTAQPDCAFLSTDDVVGQLGKVCAAEAGRVRSLLPDPGASAFFEVGAIEVELLRLSHGTGRFRDVQNLGHVIRIGNRSVLHLGDADMDPKHFAPYDFEQRTFDVALVPYWYFRHPSGKRFVEKLRAEHVVAIHVPPEELELTAALLESRFPTVLLFRESLESRRFPAGKPSGND